MKISDERLKRAGYAIERGLLEDIVISGNGYRVSYEGTHVGWYDTLTEALRAWDAAEAGEFPMESGPINYTPTWGEYDFDEDGYKVRRT